MRTILTRGLAAAAGLLLAGAREVTRAQGPSLPESGPTVRIAYAQPIDPARLTSLRVRLSLNGGEPQDFTVDTGSTGIVVGAGFIKGFDGRGEPGQLTYSSSGLREVGVWTDVQVRFPDAQASEGGPVVSRVRVLAVTRVEATGEGVNAGEVRLGRTPVAHMLGIGFGRGPGGEAGAQRRNAFVTLPLMGAGRMRRGYVIGRDGVQLGLSARTLGSGWIWQKLDPRGAAAPGAPRDWATPAGGFAWEGRRAAPGTVLIDTGLTNMMLEAGGFPQRGDLAAGERVRIFLLGGQLSYDVVVGALDSALTPRKASWRRASHGTYVNTGLRALARFDYAYDADEGYVGLRPRP